MSQAVASGFTTIIAARIEAAHQTLAARWLEQLKPLVPVPADDIFPGHRLGHMPALLLELAGFLRAPGDEAIASNAMVTAKAVELGQLRHAQKASVHQVLREYRALRTVLARFTEQQVAQLHLSPTVNELFELTDRLDAVIDVLLKTTVDTLMAEYTETTGQHTSRLESFYRMVTHELRQPLATLQFGLKMLAVDRTWAAHDTRDRLLATCERNLTTMGETLGKLVALMRSADGNENALVQQVDLSALVDDVVQQLSEMAETRGVDVRIARPLPSITIDVARLELVLVNLISNAIKYSDPHKSDRVVEIDAPSSERSGVCTVRVRDNGIGIGGSELKSIFTGFYRGHANRDGELGTSGLGLGLSIVHDCIGALRGDIHVESERGKGTTFLVELPSTPPA